MNTFRPLFSSRFLFRFSLSCSYLGKLKEGEDLPERYAFPDFTLLEHFQETVPSAEKNPLHVRGAWNEEGMYFQFFVTGKKKPLWCREHQIQQSDRLELWLDTRDVRNVHRATKYCHHFLILPTGSGKDSQQACFFALPIHRAKEQPNDIPRGSVSVFTKILPDGYSTCVFLSEKALTGFYPEEFPRMGIAWALQDQELGEITLTAGAPFAYQEDPSLWYTLELLK
ncbi:MAG: hypothetical protein Q4C96_11080 [Planctomycetia bacterium]|nr:hypothetical protein [Planctomycetia bacterium]